MKTLVYPAQNFFVLQFAGQLTNAFPALTDLQSSYNINVVNQRKLLIKNISYYFYSSAPGGQREFFRDLTGAGDDYVSLMNTADAYSNNAIPDNYFNGFFSEIHVAGTILKLGNQIDYIPIQKNRFTDLNLITDSVVTETILVKAAATINQDISPVASDITPYLKVIIEGYVFSDSPVTVKTDKFSILR